MPRGGDRAKVSKQSLQCGAPPASCAQLRFLASRSPHASSCSQLPRARWRAQVLLDWELGDMTGKEVVEKLRAEFPWVSGMKIIMVSGHAPEDETTAALAALGCAALHYRATLGPAAKAMSAHAVLTPCAHCTPP